MAKDLEDILHEHLGTYTPVAARSGGNRGDYHRGGQGVVCGLCLVCQGIRTQKLKRASVASNIQVRLPAREVA